MPISDHLPHRRQATSMRVLILGGTTEARELADGAARRAACEVTTSLAGRVERPRLPAGALRIGGFGGADGLRALGRRARDRRRDRRHPPVRRRGSRSPPRNAACRCCGSSDRAGPKPRAIAGSGSTTSPAAAARMPRPPRPAHHRPARTSPRSRASTTPGSSSAASRPRAPLPPTTSCCSIAARSRSPASASSSTRHAIDLLVTKDSGGPAPKLEAARERRLRGRRRPPPTPARARGAGHG